MDIKTIDVTAKEWFDKVNGNSYFSAHIVLNYGMPDEKTIALPFQYGYGDQYRSEAFRELMQSGVITDGIKHANGSTEGLWQYCDRHKIILRTNKIENCRKKELKEYAL